MSLHYDTLQTLKYQDLRKIAKELGIKSIGKADTLIKNIMAESSQMENKENLPESPRTPKQGITSESEASPSLPVSMKKKKQSRKKPSEFSKVGDNRASPTTPKPLPITSTSILGSSRRKSSLRPRTPAHQTPLPKTSSSLKLSLRKKSLLTSPLSKHVSAQLISKEVQNESSPTNEVLAVNKKAKNSITQVKTISPKAPSEEEDNVAHKLKSPLDPVKDVSSSPSETYIRPKLRQSARLSTPLGKHKLQYQNESRPGNGEFAVNKKGKVSKVQDKGISPKAPNEEKSQEDNVANKLESPLNPPKDIISSPPKTYNITPKLSQTARLSSPLKKQSENSPKASTVDPSMSDPQHIKLDALSSSPEGLANKNVSPKGEEININVRRRKVRSQYYVKTQEGPVSEMDNKPPTPSVVIQEPDLTEISPHRSSRRKLTHPASSQSASLRRMTHSLSPITCSPTQHLENSQSTLTKEDPEPKDILNSTMTLDKALPGEDKENSPKTQTSKYGHKNKKGPSPQTAKKPPKNTSLSSATKPRAIVTPKFSKIHQRNFEKMESLDDYLNRKKEALNKFSKIPKLSSTQVKIKESLATPIKVQTPFIPSILSAKKVQTNFAELAQKAITSTAGRTSKRAAARKKTTTKSSIKTPVAPKVFKFEGNPNTSSSSFLNSSFHLRQSFDVKASLTRKLKYKPHKGPLPALAASLPGVSKKREESRELLKGVAKNKRFLLQMSHRNLNTSQL